MDGAQPLSDIDIIEKPAAEASLKSLRQHLNQLRRQARELDQRALEDCLSLAISLTSTRRASN